MIIRREIEPVFHSLLGQYPIVTITGPRQSGKSTFVKTTLPQKAYVNLEDIEHRGFADTDPKGFLRQFPEGVILDEFQRAPNLLSHIQVLVDERHQNGMFVLTGSQQLKISETISQSLAGRTGILKLLPLTMKESLLFEEHVDWEKFIYTGFYPRIFEQKLNPNQMLGDYFETYVERDLRQLTQVRQLSVFQKFVRLCAGRIGQLLNMNSLANDVGVSHTTIKEWISVLEASHIIYLLQPLHANLSKRLTKSPKLYFTDVGLASYLLGFENSRQVFTHPLKGSLFENLVIMEAMKHRLNQGKRANFFFYRDSSGHEVDLVIESADGLILIEIKAGETFSSSYLDGLSYFKKISKAPLLHSIVVYGGLEEREHLETKITAVFAFADLLERIQA